MIPQLVALLISASVVSGPAARCGPAHSFLQQLQGRYHETIRWIGRDGVGTEDMLTEAPGGKTWTLLAIGKDAHGNAVACLLDAGGLRKASATS